MSEKRNKIFKAIADPTRREIFHLLVFGSALSISQLSLEFDISRQGVTKHLKVLEDAEMVKIEQKGREKVCFAEAEALLEIKNWLSTYDKFWDDKLKDLGEHLDSMS